MTANSSPNSSSPAQPSVPADETEEQLIKRHKRRRLLSIALLVLLLVVLACFLYYYLYARWYEDTDNAYVQGDLVQITPQVRGTVVAINADDGDYVSAGQALVELDPADTEVKLDKAKADLANTVRQVRSLFSQAKGAHSDTHAQEALVKAQEDEVKAAKASLDKAAADTKRRRALVQSGAVSAEEYAHIQDTYTQASSRYQAALSNLAATKAQLSSAQENANVRQVMVDHVSVPEHPSVKQAAAQLKSAYLDYVRSRLLAPINGYVAKRTVQLGQQVNPGENLLAVVPLDKVWVDVNYKETQMTNMRIGQAVKLHSDLYGSQVEYDGQITSLGMGTGSAFALLPAQNATGNWIKIVQRLPVRVRFTKPEQLQKYPLRIGQSMIATTKLSDTDGALLSDAVDTSNIVRTDVFKHQLQEAEQMITQIIKDNMQVMSSVRLFPSAASH